MIVFVTVVVKVRECEGGGGRKSSLGNVKDVWCVCGTTGEGRNVWVNCWRKM